jgi:hypothetical protein
LDSGASSARRGGGGHGGPHALGGPRWSSGAALRRPGGGATWWRPRALAASATAPFGAFPRAPCSPSTHAPAWPKPDLSPPTDFGGYGILALFALAAGACREGASGGVRACQEAVQQAPAKKAQVAGCRAQERRRCSRRRPRRHKRLRCGASTLRRNLHVRPAHPLPAWQKPGLSPPTGFGGDGILALFVLAESSSTGASHPPALGGFTVTVHSMAVRLRPHHE